MRPCIPALFSVCGWMMALPACAQVSWNVSFDASAAMLTATERAQISSHVQEAGRSWAAAIGVPGPRSIEVEIRIDNIPTAYGYSSTSWFYAVINGRDTFEQGVARELRSGVDPNGAAVDAVIGFGLNYLRNELWFDPNPAARVAPVPVNRTDAMSIMLHELGHVIGYNGWADLQTGQPPAAFWSSFDRWMQPGAPTRFAGPAVLRSWGSAPDLTTGNVMHWGNPALVTPRRLIHPPRPAQYSWRDGRPAPGPAGCQLLSMDPPAPGDQLDLVLRQSGSLLHQLMNGVVYLRGTRYSISALDRATLDDLDLILDRLLRSGFD